MGGLILSVVMLTWVYPAFSSKASQVKETKVRELMEDKYGISDRSASMLLSGSHETELAKTGEADATAGDETTAEAEADETASSDAERVDEADATPEDDALPAAKRH
jgi:hypothetical protein